MKRLTALKFPQSTDIDMLITTSNVGSSSDPNIFGPPFWFVLHNAAVTYPISPTAYVREKMKNLLMNLPIIVPCLMCREHFHAFLLDADLDRSVSSKESLFRFFVDIHNFVNNRYGRPSMTIEEAKKLYGFDSDKGSSVRITYRSTL